jgi:hypothetical protein
MTTFKFHDAASDYVDDLFDAAGILFAANVTLAWQLFDYVVGHPATRPVMELLSGKTDMVVFDDDA